MSDLLRTNATQGIDTILVHIPEALHHMMPTIRGNDSGVDPLDLLQFTQTMGDIASWIQRLRTSASLPMEKVKEIMADGLLLAIITDEEPSQNAFYQQYLD